MIQRIFAPLVGVFIAVGVMAGLAGTANATPVTTKAPVAAVLSSDQQAGKDCVKKCPPPSRRCKDKVVKSWHKGVLTLSDVRTCRTVTYQRVGTGRNAHCARCVKVTHRTIWCKTLRHKHHKKGHKKIGPPHPIHA